MNADAFRHLYEYHFTANRKIWDRCILPLSDAQFKVKVEYGVGSIRNHVVHMMNIDDRWFSGLRGEPVPGFLNPVHFGKREVIRARWDVVETKMRLYLDGLRDEMLFTQPFLAEKGQERLWQILLHVANHGTDHRAQLLMLLHQAGVETFPQDYFFFAIGRM